MSDEKKRILIVDDSPEDIQFLMENLKDEFAVLVGTNGQKGLELAAKEPKPNVILLDVMMPEMDGYETCRRLKENPETRDIDIIFVSAHDTTEEKLAGYDAGGSDYLIKPVNAEELLQKVKLAINNRENRRETTEEKNMAMQTAMTAITSAGEQGVVLEFLRQSFSLKNMEELARKIVESVACYDLHNTVQLRYCKGDLNLGTVEPCPPLEEELLTRLKDQDKIMSLGQRAVFNFGDISLLIKNMPEDEDKRGRLRDHLAILLEGAEAKLKSLEMGNQITQLVVDSNQALQVIEVEQKAHKTASQQIMDDMLQEVEASFLSWGLTDDQEQMLMKVVQTGIDRSLDQFEQGLAIDEQMRSIIERMNQFDKQD